MELKEAIEYFRRRILKTKVRYLNYLDSKKVITLLNYINKLQKVIDLMAEDRAEISEPKVSKEAIIDFYYKKVEEEE